MHKLFVTTPVRLLTFVKESLPYSTKDLKWTIEHGRCYVNHCVERFGSTSLNKGDEILIYPTQRPWFKQEEARVLYEDEHVLFYNKPPYIASSDLASLLKVHLIHRLDRDTTGVILFAKKDPTPFEAFFAKRAVKKTYHALVEGRPPKEGSFSGKMKKIGSREGAVVWGMASNGLWSQTDFVCEQYGKTGACLRCHPLTGRTHQIRVHMKALGYPILGDATYGSRRAVLGLFRPLLHATALEMDSYTVTAPLPPDFREWLFS